MCTHWLSYALFINVSMLVHHCVKLSVFCIVLAPRVLQFPFPSVLTLLCTLDKSFHSDFKSHVSVNHCTLTLVCTCPFDQVLESFKIMDYSLLLGVHNMDQAERERQMEGSQGGSDEKRPVAQQKALYSTAMESIQGGAACGGSIDTDDT